MALVFEYEKDLPFTENSFIGYNTSSTLFNYYVNNEFEVNEKAFAEMGYYDNVEFLDNNKQYITLKTIDKIGIKTFPNNGTIAFFKQKDEGKNMILRPVHHKRKNKAAPTLAIVTSDAAVTFNITNPSNIVYDHYRIIIVYSNGSVKDYITNTTTLTIPPLNMDEVSEIYCIGYIGEADNISDNSNNVILE